MRSSSTGCHDARQLGPVAPVRCAAVRQRIQCRPDLVEAQPDALGDLDEPDPSQHVGVIPTMPRIGAIAPDQSIGLVETERRGGDTGAGGDLSDRERLRKLLTSTIVEVLPSVDMSATNTVPTDTSPSVAHDTGLLASDVPIGAMRMVKVDGHRICLVRTADGFHAIDHACPHEGYGLTQGELDGDLLTCAWHNWKFRVTDGACVQGEEGVQSHPST